MMNGRSRRSALLLLGGPALAGCDGLGVPGVAGVGVTSGAAAPASAHVDSPEVFRVAEPGLWDGRPSLGGICVAHLDVIDPERVRIVNATNGQGVIGALFRRERDLPAPALQVSSNAAEALGMLAGAPTALDVKALRRQDAPAAPAEEPAPAAKEAPAAEASESEAEAEASLEIVAA
jgi:hypothetical protein